MMEKLSICVSLNILYLCSFDTKGKNQMLFLFHYLQMNGALTYAMFSKIYNHT